MLKTYRILVYALFAIAGNFSPGWAQNLVNNWSFEDTVACPTALGQISNSIGWYPTRNTPDFYNTCSQGPVSVPYNYGDYQWPRTGNAYSGFLAINLLGTNLREILSSQLNFSMQIGTRYHVKLFVSRIANESSGVLTNIATDKIGIQFSTIAYSISSPPPINNQAQVFSNLILTDTSGWTEISGSFVADSLYNYINIGNFFDDFSTNYIQYNPNIYQGYYFVDDICVSSDSLYCELLSGNNEIHPINHSLFRPNPAQDFIYFKNFNQFEILNIYDVNGKIVLTHYLTSIGEYKIDVSYLSNGVYIVEYENSKCRKLEKLFITNP